MLIIVNSIPPKGDRREVVQKLGKKVRKEEGKKEGNRPRTENGEKR